MEPIEKDFSELKSSIVNYYEGLNKETVCLFFATIDCINISYAIFKCAACILILLFYWDKLPRSIKSFPTEINELKIKYKDNDLLVPLLKDTKKQYLKSWKFIFCFLFIGILIIYEIYRL